MERVRTQCDHPSSAKSVSAIRHLRWCLRLRTGIGANITALLIFATANAANAGIAVEGVIQDKSGRALRGIFVQARNTLSSITTSVLSDREGRYWFDNLPPGPYRISTAAVGFSKEEHHVTIESTGRVAINFALERLPVEWTELSWVDYVAVLPERPGKTEAISSCSLCHGLRWQSLYPRDLTGWKIAVNGMWKEFPFIFGPPEKKRRKDEIPGRLELTPQKVELIASYYASAFGPEASLPAYPPITPRGYYSDDALQIVFVDYDMPTRRAFPWSGWPDKEGNVWIPQYNSNQIAKLNPETGEVKEFKVPHRGRAAVHSAVRSPDGLVWLTESSDAHKIARFDPATEEFVEYLDSRKEGKAAKHTNVIDVKGRVWSTGGDKITMFDPVAETFVYYGDKPLTSDSYGIATDKAGNVWFTRRLSDAIGKIDGKTGKVTEWARPKNSGPRRIHVDSKGMVWFGEYFASRAVKFDPNAEIFDVYELPGPEARPYATGIDSEDNFWYYAWGRSELGRIEAKTGTIRQYPVPYSDALMKDFFTDSKGRLWFGSPPFNKVGYFYLRDPIRE